MNLKAAFLLLSAARPATRRGTSGLNSEQFVEEGRRVNMKTGYGEQMAASDWTAAWRLWTNHGGPRKQQRVSNEGKSADRFFLFPAPGLGDIQQAVLHLPHFYIVLF